MKSLAIVFLLLAVPAAIQCKPALTERQVTVLSTVDTTGLNALIQRIIQSFFGSSGALNNQQTLQPFLQQLLNASIGVNGTITSQLANPKLGLDVTSTLNKLLDPLLKQGGAVQNLLTGLGGDPDALKELLVLLLGQNGILQSLLGPNGVLGQLLSGKPLDLEAIVQNLLQTLLSAPSGVLDRLIDYLLGPGGLLESGALGNVLKPLIGPGGVLTNLVNSLVGTTGNDFVTSLKQLLKMLLGDLSGNPSNFAGAVGTLLNTLLGENGILSKLLVELGLIPGGGGGGLGGLLTGLFTGLKNLVGGVLGGGGSTGGGTTGGNTDISILINQLKPFLIRLLGGGSGSTGGGTTGGITAKEFITLLLNLWKGGTTNGGSLDISGLLSLLQRLFANSTTMGGAQLPTIENLLKQLIAKFQIGGGSNGNQNQLNDLMNLLTQLTSKIQLGQIGGGSNGNQNQLNNLANLLKQLIALINGKQLTFNVHGG